MKCNFIANRIQRRRWFEMRSSRMCLSLEAVTAQLQWLICVHAEHTMLLPAKRWRQRRKNILIIDRCRDKLWHFSICDHFHLLPSQCLPAFSFFRVCLVWVLHRSFEGECFIAPTRNPSDRLVISGPTNLITGTFQDVIKVSFERKIWFACSMNIHFLKIFFFNQHVNNIHVCTSIACPPQRLHHSAVAGCLQSVVFSEAVPPLESGLGSLGMIYNHVL